MSKNISVCIDAGHSSKFKGARGNGINEEELVLKIALKVGEILSRRNVKVLYTRKNGNPMNDASNSSDLNTRCSYANNNKVDYFISIHNNSASSITASGHETLYNTRYSNSKTLASNIQNALISETKMNNRGLKLRTDLRVLNGTNMGSCLVEIGFLSNSNDASKLKDSTFVDKISSSIAKGICQTCGIAYDNIKDEELEQAIDRLDKNNIKLQKECWNSINVINLDNVPFLIERFGGLDYLVYKKVIENIDIWTKEQYNANHVRMLIIKSSKILDNTIPNASASEKVSNCIEMISKFAIDNYKNSKVLPSLVIAQACWESGYLTSELSLNANNPFGMKYNAKLETHGAYSYKKSKWCIFDSIESAVVQQGKFYNMYERYSGIVGERDIEKVLSSLEKSGYCEGSGYSENIKRMISQYNLIEYDKKVLQNEYDIIDVSKDSKYQEAIKRFFELSITTQESWYYTLTSQHTEALIRKTGNYMYGTETYEDAVKQMKKNSILTSEIWDNSSNVKATHLRSFIIKVSKII